MINTQHNVFTEQELDYLNQVVLSTDIDWSLQPRTVKHPTKGNYDHPYMSHVLVSRVNESDPGTVNSGLWDFFEPVFHRVRERMGIGCKSILRANLNLSWHHPWEYGVPHIDHQDRDHWNMVIYLTPISSGGTYIFTENLELMGQTGYDLHSAVAFPGLMHCQGFCAPGETRVVAVITWCED
jgi:hypothetical protein